MTTFPAALLLVLSLGTAAAQTSPERLLSLRPESYRNGTATLRAFTPVTALVRPSILKLNIDDRTVALGAIIDPKGLVVTKASEVAEGKLTATLADGRKVDARIVAADTENDLALVQIEADGLKPIEWAANPVAPGQWVITPGTGESPEAVGIVSVAGRKIPPKRALIGVELAPSREAARIATTMPDMGAREAGLKSGDLILAVNGSEVGGRDDLIEQLRKFRAGATVTLRVRRDDSEFEALVPLRVPKPSSNPRDLSRQERMNRMGGDLSERAEGFEVAFQHDTVLEPWQCGGAIINLEGQALGLNIARAGRIASYALPADLVQRIVAALAKEH